MAKSILKIQQAMALVLALLLTAPVVTLAGSDGKKHYKQGMQFEENQQWDKAAEQFALEFDCLGEGSGATLRYRGHAELADPAAWDEALGRALARDQARGMTTVGPHRDDLREFGSNGQQRGAAVALKLIELAALRQARGSEPALLLDDVFAAFDRERQRRLARRLLETPERQVFLTAPRRDELPADLALPVWRMDGGRVAA